MEIKAFRSNSMSTLEREVNYFLEANKKNRALNKAHQEKLCSSKICL